MRELESEPVPSCSPPHPSCLPASPWTAQETLGHPRRPTPVRTSGPASSSGRQGPRGAPRGLPPIPEHVACSSESWPRATHAAHGQTWLRAPPAPRGAECTAGFQRLGVTPRSCDVPVPVRGPGLADQATFRLV